jgi:hypothetical protein
MADAPLLKEPVGKVGCFQAFQRVDGNYGNLGVSFLFDFGAQRGQLLPGLLAEHTGKVVDVTLGLERRDFFCAQGSGSKQKKARNQHPGEF